MCSICIFRGTTHNPQAPEMRREGGRCVMTCSSSSCHSGTTIIYFTIKIWCRYNILFLLLHRYLSTPHRRIWNLGIRYWSENKKFVIPSRVLLLHCRNNTGLFDQPWLQFTMMDFAGEITINWTCRLQQWGPG